jgi:hypothetical protein
MLQVLREQNLNLHCSSTLPLADAAPALLHSNLPAASDSRQLAEAKADMLQVVREQYSCFMMPVDNTRPIPDVNMWSNPVYS